MEIMKSVSKLPKAGQQKLRGPHCWIVAISSLFHNFCLQLRQFLMCDKLAQNLQCKQCTRESQVGHYRTVRELPQKQWENQCPIRWDWKKTTRKKFVWLAKNQENNFDLQVRTYNVPEKKFNLLYDFWPNFNFFKQKIQTLQKSCKHKNRWKFSIIPLMRIGFTCIRFN